MYQKTSLNFKSFLFIFLLAFWSLQVYAQDGFDDDYSTEISYGFNFNTNAGLLGGLMIKYSQLYRPRIFTTIGLEVMHVKHEKELRYRSFASNSTWILGKVNYFFPVRPQIGIDYVLFKKAPDEGIHINAVFAGGPSIGVQKPYMIFYNYSVTGTGQSDVRLEPYDPRIHRDINRIEGSGGYLQGFDESEILFGVNLKAGLSFEFGKLNEDVIGMEAGFTYEAFPRDPIILSSDFDFNRRQFTAAYLTLYYGIKR